MTEPAITINTNLDEGTKTVVASFCLGAMLVLVMFTAFGPVFAEPVPPEIHVVDKGCSGPNDCYVEFEVRDDGAYDYLYVGDTEVSLDDNVGKTVRVNVDRVGVMASTENVAGNRWFPSRDTALYWVKVGEN